MLEDFFAKIPQVFDKKVGKGRHIQDQYWYYLAPTHRTDSEFIQKFQDLIDKTEKDDPDNTSFLKVLKGHVDTLKIIGQGRAASQKYLDELAKSKM